MKAKLGKRDCLRRHPCKLCYKPEGKRNIAMAMWLYTTWLETWLHKLYYKPEEKKYIAMAMCLYTTWLETWPHKIWLSFGKTTYQ